jgi:hypothetical protein
MLTKEVDGTIFVRREEEEEEPRLYRFMWLVMSKGFWRRAAQGHERHCTLNSNRRRTMT